MAATSMLWQISQHGEQTFVTEPHTYLGTLKHTFALC